MLTHYVVNLLVSIDWKLLTDNNLRTSSNSINHYDQFKNKTIEKFYNVKKIHWFNIKRFSN